MNEKLIDCYDLGDLHFEIWLRPSSRVYELIFTISGIGTPTVQRYASAASARRAMYKFAWDFAEKKVSLPWR